MSSKRTLEDWDDALEFLSRSQPISGTNEDVFPILKHSYDYLNGDNIKKCFLCCALWPEDCNIDKRELIQCWMGLGLLYGSGVDERYRYGRKNIQMLKDACLLEAGKYEDREVKMHDVIRDMALQIASEEYNWMVRDFLDGPIDVNQVAAVECLSLVSETFSLFERNQGFMEGVLPKLSTLILNNSDSIVERIPSSFFTCIPNLTYLTLSRSGLRKVPREICDLTGLQYLNLSFTYIQSLPKEFGRLEKLRYLFLSDTKMLEKETPEVMPRALEVLDLFGSSLNWGAEGGIVFRRLEKLQVLEGITVQSNSMLQLLSKLSHVQIRMIGIYNIDGLAFVNIKQLFGGGHLRNHLEWLDISSLSDLTELRVDFENQGVGEMAWNLKKLEVLYLRGLDELEKIVWRGVEPKDFLPRLRRLHIFCCDKLKNISWVLQLRCLEDLAMSWCKEMTTLIDENEIREGTVDLPFPRLKKLFLHHLPELEGIYQRGLTFPSLETIDVELCPKLRRLPFHSLMTNIKIKGKQVWWDRLQWEDESIRTSLRTHFLPR